MAATFTYAACYEIDACCVTPLRTGGPDGDPEAILESWDGTALLQASSLAGALRGWLESSRYAALSEALFGSQKAAGHLMVSDGRFDRASERYIRPRLRINRQTGTADDGGKFDTAHVGSGGEFRFTLTWLGLGPNEKELTAVEQMLGALNAGEIRLGAQKSNGFGRVRLAVRRRNFDLTDARDRADWLAGRCSGTPVSLPEGAESRRVTFLVSGKADSLLVKSGAPLPQKDGSSYMPNLTEGGRAVLPGSSIKGAVRSRAGVIADLLGLGSDAVDEFFGRGAEENDNGKPGRIFFEDACLANEKKKQITRIRINRFTGGVIRGGLFTEEPLSCGVEMRVTAPNHPEACALLLYALRDLGLGLYNLGSGGSIGRGYLTVREIKAVTPDGKQSRLLFDENRHCSAEDPDGVFRGWLRELGGTCHEA